MRVNELVQKSDCPRSTLATIILVSTNKKLTRSLKQLFESEGYILQLIDDAVSGFDACRSCRDCLTITDLSLPNNSGYELCRRLLNVSPESPLIAIGPQSDVAGKISLLEMGACDYVGTPFNARELLARVRAALRRRKHKEEDQVFAFADIVVNLQKMEVRRASRTVALGKKAFEILTLMITNQKRVITRQEFVQKVWNGRRHLSMRAVDQQILKLREKLETDRRHPVHFRTVHSIGYKFLP